MAGSIKKSLCSTLCSCVVVMYPQLDWFCCLALVLCTADAPGVFPLDNLVFSLRSCSFFNLF